MLAAETRWSFSENFLKIDIKAETTKTDIPIVDEEVESFIISKMVNLIEGAEQFDGEPFCMTPNDSINMDQNTLVIRASIIFKTFDDKENFKKECSNLLK